MSQSFEKHAQYTPGYHYFTSPLGIIFVVWSIQRLIANPGIDTAYMLVGALALFGAIAMLRLSSLRVQDRIIRLEERLRLARILPTDLQTQIESLRPSHLIALRFASDAEVTDLVRKVLADPTIKPKEIKRQVRSWRADYFRA